MLENIGKRIQTFLLVLIIVLLSVIMAVIGFGTPGAEGCAASGPAYAAKVYGKTISEGDFRAAYIVTNFNRVPTQRAQAQRLREYTLDGLIERELLVREAERLGFTADPDAIMRRVAEDEEVLLSGPVDAPPGYPAGRIQINARDRNGNFSAEYLRRIIQNRLRRSVAEFVEWQVHETLADEMRDTVTASVSVSPREVWDAYVQETEQAKLSYVRFDPRHFQSQVEMSDEAIAAWMEENAEEIDREYRRQRHRYTDLPEQTRARHILIEVGREASDAERAEARRQAEELLRRLQEEGADFAALAREHSSDEGSAARGGDLGWFPRGRMVPPFEEAAFGNEPGTLVGELVESQFGFHIIEVLGRREGDVPEDEAKREIAEDLYRRDRAGELARAAADRALAYLREGHSMEELDERLLHGWDEPTGADAEGTEAEAEEADEAGEPEEAPERSSRAPQVRETRSFGRSERAIPEDTGELTRTAFEMSLEEPLPEEPIELRDSWYVYRLDERTEADREDFDAETRDRIERRLVRQKEREVLSAYIGGLRARAEADGAIRINPEILSYGVSAEDAEDDEGSEETASR
jgi:peptidyl-prolyl cis-trans isomerase D